MRVYYHAACTEYCTNFCVALKIIDVIHKKQMHDSVITEKNMLLNIDLCYINVFDEF